MYMLVRNILTIVIFLVLSACSSSRIDDIDDRDDSGEIYMTGYIPYIESITLPERISAGEKFNVVLHVSTNLNPELLFGRLPTNRVLTTGYRNNDIGAVGPMIDLFFGKKNTGTGAAQYDYPVELRAPAEPGTYPLFVLSADAPEWGGVEVSIQLMPGFTIYPQDHITDKEYEFTVLPPEE